MMKSKKDAASSSHLVLLKNGFPTPSSNHDRVISLEAFTANAQILVDFEAAYQRKQFEAETTVVASLEALNASGAFKFKGESKTDESAAAAAVRPIFKIQR